MVVHDKKHITYSGIVSIFLHIIIKKHINKEIIATHSSNVQFANEKIFSTDTTNHMYNL